jgi:hypothetical protein
MKSSSQPQDNSTDPISGETQRWYSSASSPARYEDGLYDYCLYCLQNFHRFYDMVNNVCQSCGRVADPVFKNKQEKIEVTSVNSILGDTERLKAASLEFDYSNLLSVDDTTSGLNDRDTRMTANSIGEALTKLRVAEQRNTTIARAARLRGLKYIQKSTYSAEDSGGGELLYDGNINNK